MAASGLSACESLAAIPDVSSPFSAGRIPRSRQKRSKVWEVDIEDPSDTRLTVVGRESYESCSRLRKAFARVPHLMFLNSVENPPKCVYTIIIGERP